MKSDPSNMVMICGNYETWFIRRQCLKKIFDKSHVEPGPSNTVLVCSIYKTRSNKRQSRMFKTNLSNVVKKKNHVKAIFVSNLILNIRGYIWDGGRVPMLFLI